MVFPQRFLFSMGIAGVMVALIAAAIALLVLPAVLALLGTRINSLAPKSWRRRSEHADEQLTSGFWYRLSNARDAPPGAGGRRHGGRPDPGRAARVRHQVHLGGRERPAHQRQRAAGLRHLAASSPRPQPADYIAITAPDTPQAQAALGDYAQRLARCRTSRASPRPPSPARTPGGSTSTASRTACGPAPRTSSATSAPPRRPTRPTSAASPPASSTRRRASARTCRTRSC